MTINRPNPDDIPQEELQPNSAAEEFFGRIKHDFRRPKPNADAVASALQAIQKLAGDVALEQFEQGEAAQGAGEKCSKCGATNSGKNRFCGYCGTLLGRNAAAANSAIELMPGNTNSGNESNEQHIYHHHHHHHYFSESPSQVPPLSSPSDSGTQDGTVQGLSDSPPDPETVIQRLVQEWSVYFNSRRLEELAGLYAIDAIVLRPNSPPAHGSQAIHQLFQSARESGLGDVELDCADIGIVGNFASLTGHSKMLVPIGAHKRGEQTGKYLIVARRDGSEWKIVADAWCMDSPPAQVPTQNAAVLPIRTPRK